MLSTVLVISDSPSMPPPATTATSVKPTGDEPTPTENGLSADKNQSLTISPLNKIDKVVVHPLVLLSVVDHFNRMGKIGNSQRVVGLLLGSLKNKILDVSNSFARKCRRDDQQSPAELSVFQCRSTKKRRKKTFGFSITSISRTCTPCSAK